MSWMDVVAFMRAVTSCKIKLAQLEGVERKRMDITWNCEFETTLKEEINCTGLILLSYCL